MRTHIDEYGDEYLERLIAVEDFSTEHDMQS